MAEVAKWTIVAFMTLNALGVVVVVGRPRKPIDGLDAAAIVAIYALLIIAIMVWW